MQRLKSVNVIVTVFIFLINQAAGLPCSPCHEQCDFNETTETTITVTCQGINDIIPQCLPKDTKELIILNSPEFALVGESHLRRYKRLKRLSIVKTGLKEIHENAFHGLEDLKTIEIKHAPNFRNFSPGTFSSRSKLQTITVEKCPSFRTLQGGIFQNLTNLQVLKLGYNSVQDIGEDILDQSINVRSIDLSYNKPLEYLPRYVFTRLRNLNSLVLANCSLRVLYPEHVRTPYESASLSNFDGRYNIWQCNHMQEFIAWLQVARPFSGIARMGRCSSPHLLLHQPVLLLMLYQVGSSRYTLPFSRSDAFPISTATTYTTQTKSESNVAAPSEYSHTWITIVVITIVVISLVIFLLAAKVCSCGRRSSNEASHRPTRGVTDPRNYRNQGFDELDVARATQSSREMIRQSDCNVGDWDINNIDPPSYEDVIVNDAAHGRRQGSDKLSDTPAGSEKTAPPPYDGVKDVV